MVLAGMALSIARLTKIKDQSVWFRRDNLSLGYGKEPTFSSSSAVYIVGTRVTRGFTHLVSDG